MSMSSYLFVNLPTTHVYSDPFLSFSESSYCYTAMKVSFTTIRPTISVEVINTTESSGTLKQNLLLKNPLPRKYGIRNLSLRFPPAHNQLRRRHQLDWSKY